MTDRTLLFDELLRMPNVRARTYEIQEIPGRLVCVSLEARRLDDWYFARRWLSIESGRRLLYWLLDEAEAAGYRFRVHQSTSGDADAQERAEPWQRAQEAWSGLSDEEQRIHRDLFPQEWEMLRRGYDWDHQNVFRDGRPLSRDPFGRVFEEVDGTVFEWVIVPSEWTWRRYPLYVKPVVTSGTPPVSGVPETAA